MVTLMYKCSYVKIDTGQTIDVPSSCMFLIIGHLRKLIIHYFVGGPNFTISRANFIPGLHILIIIIKVEGDRPLTFQLRFQGNTATEFKFYSCNYNIIYSVIPTNILQAHSNNYYNSHYQAGLS